MAITGTSRPAFSCSSGMRSRISLRATLGNHASPNATTRSSTVGPLPPTSTGGCGVCAGFGHDQIRSKFTNRPW